jgi:hypothetical protein
MSLYAQHTVNDIAQYNGWFQVEVRIMQSGNIFYDITQCYPGGEEYEVRDSEKEKLPLYLKIVCLGMIDEGMKDAFNFDEMSFSEDGYLMQLTAFSFTFIFDFTKTENEILSEFGDEMISKYRYRKW